jgi:glycosyltransferase involved in cell wall biosynthesis
MHRDLRLSVVIPCYNEEHGIPHVVAKIPEAVDEILVLDNCSTDRTVEVAKASGPKVRVVQHPRNLGYGGSYIRGLPMAEGDIIITTDGDGTYPVEDCLRLVDLIVERHVDFISCSRFPLQDLRGMHPRSRFGNAVLNALVNGFYGLNLADGQSGMWIFKKSILPMMRLESTGMAFSNEIKLEAFQNPKIRAIEAPIRYRERIGESKLYPFRDGMRMVNYLTRRRLDELRRLLAPSVDTAPKPE